MRLTDILDPTCVAVPMQATNKRAAIDELVNLLAACGKVTDRQQVLTSVMEREATRTTGIGNGLAIPHGKTAGVSTLVMAIGKPAAPIDFEATDGKPVSLIILLASPPDQTGPHIQALARISRLMTMETFRKQLEQAKSPRELYDAIGRQESQMAEVH